MPKPRRSIHFAYYFLQVSLLITALGGCTPKALSSKEEVRVAIGSSPASLDPRLATDATGMGISSLLFTALFHLDSHLGLVGELADKWSYRDLTYTFILRPDLTFSDHSPVTEEDLVFSFAEFMNPSCAFSSNFKMIDHIDVHYSSSVHSLKIKLKKFSSSFLTDLRVIKILPKKLVEKDRFGFASHPIGSGNFALVHDESNKIELQAREDSLVRPKIKYLSFYFIRDDYTRFLKLLSHEVDLAENEIDLRRVAEFVKRPDEFEVQKNPSLSMTYLLINLKRDLLKNVKVRQALDLALNRGDILKYKLEELALPATSLLSPIHPMFNSSLKNPDFNLEAARKLLTGIELGSTSIQFKSSNTSNAVENVSVLVDQFKKLGLKFKQQSFEWGTFYSDIKSGNYDLALSKWVGLIDADIYRQAFDSHETPPGRNRGFYANPIVDSLVSKALETEDFETRRKLYFEAQKIVFEDLPVIPLWYDLDIAIVSRRIKNFHAYPTGDFQFANEIEKE